MSHDAPVVDTAKNGDPTTKPWTSFDELKEMNTQAGRLATLIGLVAVFLGLADFKNALSQNWARASVFGPQLPPTFPGVEAGFFAMFALGGLAAYVLLASSALGALAALANPLPPSDSTPAILAEAAAGKRLLCRGSMKSLRIAIVIIVLVEWGSLLGPEFGALPAWVGAVVLIVAIQIVLGLLYGKAIEPFIENLFHGFRD